MNLLGSLQQDLGAIFEELFGLASDEEDIDTDEPAAKGGKAQLPLCELLQQVCS